MTLPRVFNDPLWLFLLFGGLLFVIAATQEDQRVIRVTEGDIQRIEEQWQQQMRRDPTPAERASLINQFIRDEAYYQEALALQLDAGDTIVKRRLIQKLSFLTEDLVGTVTPDEATAPGVSYETSRRLPNARAILFQPHLFFCGPAR